MPREDSTSLTFLPAGQVTDNIIARLVEGNSRQFTSSDNCKKFLSNAISISPPRPVDCPQTSASGAGGQGF